MTSRDLNITKRLWKPAGSLCFCGRRPRPEPRGAAAPGWLPDRTSMGFVYKVCAFLPAIGLLTALLPNLRRPV